MFAENDQCASLGACTHPQSHIGLDAVYCPDCRESFSSHTKEYQRATNRDRTGTESSPQIAPNEHPDQEHLYYQVGDRVKTKDDPYSLYEIVKISDDDHVKLRCLAFVAGARGGGDRSVPLFMVQVIDRLVQDDGSPVSVPEPPCASVREQSDHAVPLNTLGEVHEVSHIGSPLNRSGGRAAIPPQSRPPEQSMLNHNPVPLNTLGEVHGWIEKYMVKCRWEHHRYCWQMGGRRGKVCRMHIPRDSGKLLAVRSAIAMRRSPQEIEQLIKSWRNPVT